MAQVLTFIGKGGVGCTTMAIAAAKKLAQQGERVLLASQDPSPVVGLLLGHEVGTEPQTIAPNLSAVQFSSPDLMTRVWEDEVKAREAQYVRFPLLRNVYGQELGLFPGMDSALALYQIRTYNQSNQYDVIVYDGAADLNTLRTLGIPDTGSWYLRRFRNVLLESDLGKAIAPFIQPLSSAILNVSWSWDNFADQPTQETQDLLDEGKTAIANPQRVLTYLVTDASPAAIATAQYYWGSAQQVGLSVGGVLWNQATPTDDQVRAFLPIPSTPVPTLAGGDWDAIANPLPNFRDTDHIPRPLTIDTASRQVRVFLPGFDKKQVKLTQYGPELTIEAGDQRRNIFLPPPLSGQPVKGAKFQDHYLIISL
ncbi:Get3/ArsA fold putative tail anchor-mediating ATPase NosAFP [Spirulina major]|uniref:Get3/ArsA fold putative tail anchor-mediating ATPase NosAFP n=1 Tax=Spirulina major TaxID=270636 RepID=UPI000933CC7C|nr:ArsA family ATPase [Spirulina major]